jgi:effector-binding domain-containing protein
MGAPPSDGGSKQVRDDVETVGSEGPTVGDGDQRVKGEIVEQRDDGVQHVIREETLFAGIRKPIKGREELLPRIAEVRKACEGRTVGPLTHILRFDTPVDGFDSEIGFPVSSKIDKGDVRTHTLRPLHFFSLTHRGAVKTLRETTKRIVEHMERVGLSSELEFVEIYHAYDPEDESRNDIETRVAFLAWPELYREQLVRVLGERPAAMIWSGGESITPFTEVDERAAWVGASLERLKERSDQDQQFDILSRVALLRPAEDVSKFKEILSASGGDVQAVLDAQNEDLEQNTPFGGWIDPPWADGATLHLSKVAYNRSGYDEAKTHEELRQAYCFCTLVRAARDPKIDPIFCYRAAGWARQFWEPILGVEFKHCAITQSILKGDRFCAWDYDLTDIR